MLSENPATMLGVFVPHTAFVCVTGLYGVDGANPPWNQPHVIPFSLSTSPMFFPMMDSNVSECGSAVII